MRMVRKYGVLSVLRFHLPCMYLRILPGTTAERFHKIDSCFSSVHPTVSLGSLHCFFLLILAARELHEQHISPKANAHS